VRSVAARPPGPRGHWLLGSLPDVRRDMPQTLIDVTREYGPVTRLRVGPASMYLVADGDLIVEMIARRAVELRKSNRTRTSLGGHLGQGLITLEGERHRRHRRLMQPVMHTQAVAVQARTIVDLARARMASWPDGSIVDIYREMADLTLRIVCAALFRIDDAYEDLVDAVHDFARSLNVVLRRAFPLPEWVPTPGNRLRRDTVRRVDTYAYELIQRRRAQPADGGDLLSLLLQANADDGGPGLSDVEVRDELMTMFFAGHETSAAALTWALYLLDTHPDVAAQAREQVRAVVGERPATMDDLPALPLLGQVVKETLRLYPPAWVFDRSPLHDIEVGGYRIPRGANVLFSPWVVHRDPDRWPDPDAFRPQRFEAGFVAPRGSYLPFGDGPRICVGNRFAEAEIALVLATLLPAVELSRVDNGEARPEGDATLRPRGGLRMRIRRLPGERQRAARAERDQE
jgi:cytochrome P450